MLGRINSDNEFDFIAKAVQAWMTRVGAHTARITSGNLWENLDVEGFDAHLRREIFNAEIVYNLKRSKR